MWPYNIYALAYLRWLAQLHSGWVIGCVQGATRSASLTSQSLYPGLRTPLLTAHVSNLKLRQHVPQPPSESAKKLYLV